MNGIALTDGITKLTGVVLKYPACILLTNIIQALTSMVISTPPNFIPKENRSKRRMAAIWFIAAILGIAASSTELALQPEVIRHGRSLVGVNFALKTETGSVPFGMNTDGDRIYRGIFVVAVYTLSRYDLETMRVVPDKIPAGSTIELYKLGRVPADLRGIIPDVIGYHPTDRYRFIGRVSLRREILWTTLGLSSAALLWNIAALSQIQLKIQRFKRGLCARCAYPLPIEEEDPRCPECGTLHCINRHH